MSVFNDEMDGPKIPSKTIDNSIIMKERFYLSMKNQDMTDVDLEVNGITFPCHRLFLALSSDVFRAMLMPSMWSEGCTKTVKLVEDPKCYSVFPMFLRYIYTHEIEVTIHNVMPIVILADKYMVKDLLKSCEQFIILHFAQATLSRQIVSWLDYSLSRPLWNGLPQIIPFVCHNFEMFMSSTPVETVNFNLLVRLLESSEIVVEDELTLLKYMMKWLQAHRDVTDFEQILSVVLSHIRFPMLSRDQLGEVLINPLCSEFLTIFFPQLRLGMNYQIGNHDNYIDCIKDSEWGLQFIPRFYANNAHSALLTIENVTILSPYHVSTLVFSSHAWAKRNFEDREKSWEWVVEVYPKGVWIKKCILINWMESLEVPEYVLRTVRLSVFCKDPPNYNKPLRVMVGFLNDRLNIAILIYGKENGIEHIIKVIKKINKFTETDRVLHFDDLVPFTEWNDVETLYARSGVSSKYLVGSNGQEFKLRIIIQPVDNEVTL